MFDAFQQAKAAREWRGEIVVFGVLSQLALFAGPAVGRAVRLGDAPPPKRASGYVTPATSYEERSVPWGCTLSLVPHWPVPPTGDPRVTVPGPARKPDSHTASR